MWVKAGFLCAVKLEVVGSAGKLNPSRPPTALIPRPLLSSSAASLNAPNAENASASSLGGRSERRSVSSSCSSRGFVRSTRPCVRAEVAGQYEDSFADVQKSILQFFTFKAVRAILKEHKEAVDRQQGRGSGTSSLDSSTPGLYKKKDRHRRSQNSEEDDVEVPTMYSTTLAYEDGEWLQKFIVTNTVRDSKLFLRSLVQERRGLAEQVMTRRLKLYNGWAKQYNYTVMHVAIEDQNLELLRERLMQTVKFQPEDSEEGSTTP